ncbi:enolase C-terminal domain-like protein [Acetobacter aceti]|uniref:Mandelate racemase n=1 Tax=Acetobacter aceti TaxID=435 RepID=A0A6S6PF21_ACEAC|nr:enolase C-terminal domain-like protein [Acetobacter aceti]BCI66348.1 mandelate racemase [Acetobacter aceti]
MAQDTSGNRDLPKIRNYTVRQVVVPFEQPLTTANGAMHAAPMVLLDLVTDAGVVGHAYLFCYTQTVLKAVAQLSSDVVATVVGVAAAPHKVRDELRARFRLLGTAGLLDMVLSLVDMALWDAWSKHLGQPLVAALGGDLTNDLSIPVYASYGMSGVAETEKNIAQALEEGHHHVKIKIGHPKLTEDIKVVEAALKMMADKAVLLVDYNQSLSVAEALVRCSVLDEYGLGWIEEPTSFDDFEGQAEIARRCRTPIQIGENLWGPQQIAESISARCSDLIMPDLGKVGGVSGWQKATAVCEAYRIPVSNHFYQEVSAHLLAVTTGAQLLEYFRMADPILVNPLEVKAGQASVQRIPGSGVVWREDQIELFMA